MVDIFVFYILLSIFIMAKYDKIKAFDYMLQLIEDWRTDFFTSKKLIVKPLSKLIVLKLLFLIAAPKKNGGLDLLDTFNNFHALPYGPVESDIYNAILDNKIPSYYVKDRSVEVKDKQVYDTNDPLCIEIKKALNDLKNINPSIISLNSFELVEITHKWDSWNRSMKFAEFMGRSSAKMLTESIRSDSNKCFK